MHHIALLFILSFSLSVFFTRPPSIHPPSHPFLRFPLPPTLACTRVQANFQSPILKRSRLLLVLSKVLLLLTWFKFLRPILKHYDLLVSLSPPAFHTTDDRAGVKYHCQLINSVLLRKKSDILTFFN